LINNDFTLFFFLPHGLTDHSSLYHGALDMGLVFIWIMFIHKWLFLDFHPLSQATAEDGRYRLTAISIQPKLFKTCN
jgi:hypothetical protein